MVLEIRKAELVGFGDEMRFAVGFLMFVGILGFFWFVFFMIFG